MYCPLPPGSSFINEDPLVWRLQRHNMEAGVTSYSSPPRNNNDTPFDVVSDYVAAEANLLICA